MALKIVEWKSRRSIGQRDSRRFSEICKDIGWNLVGPVGRIKRDAGIVD